MALRDLSLSFVIAVSLAAAACSSAPSAKDGPAPAGAAPMDAGAPASDAAPVDPRARACTGAPGTFHDQPFDSGGETRHYWLHVPATYACKTPVALVVDFHGTGYGSATDTVEESFATPELEAAADAFDFIVVRPRSRFKAAPQSGSYYYQWDINDGDVARNKEFALALLESLAQRYSIDPARVYATGFSNGPSMAAQFLADEPSKFHGYGLIAGGLNAPLKRSASFGAEPPRVYSMTGFRDYMQDPKEELERFLSQHGHPADHRFNREADTGHEVYGWHFREAFAWMDGGKRPAKGTLRAPWQTEPTGTAESIVEMTADPSGGLVAVGAAGGVYARSSAGWTKKASLDIGPLTDVCFTPSGHGFAVGHGHLATTDASGTWTVAPDLPEFGAQQFGFTYATSIGCSATRITAGGVWSSATSTDDGANWTASAIGAAGDPTFVTAVRPSSFGWLALGYYDYVGTSPDGGSFTGVSMATATQWWNDGVLSAAVGVAVGEAGALRTTPDGGKTWSLVKTPTTEDLYAVEVRGARIVAVGSHGAVIQSSDGGATWKDISTGLDGFLGTVRFVDDATVIVAGEGGVALRASL